MCKEQKKTQVRSSQHETDDISKQLQAARLTVPKG